MFGGNSNFSIIKEASSAELIRLYLPPPPSDSDNPNRSSSKYVVDLTNYELGESKVVSGSELGKFRSLISDSTIDDPNSDKGCVPVFGVRFSFEDGDTTLDVNLCFECDLIWVSRNDEILGGGDFDPVHDRFAGLVRPFFPDDPEIQGLE